jgi:hypothetical protein
MVQTDEMRKEKRMQVKQLKVRDGTGEDFEVEWDFELMRFCEVPKDPAYMGPTPNVFAGDLKGNDDPSIPVIPMEDSNIPF